MHSAQTYFQCAATFHIWEGNKPFIQPLQENACLRFKLFCYELYWEWTKNSTRFLQEDSHMLYEIKHVFSVFSLDSGLFSSQNNEPSAFWVPECYPRTFSRETYVKQLVYSNGKESVKLHSPKHNTTISSSHLYKSDKLCSIKVKTKYKIVCSVIT
jgi:hypothetical protein